MYHCNLDAVYIYLDSKNPETIGLTGSMYLADKLYEEKFTVAVSTTPCVGLKLSCTELAKNQSTCLPDGHLDIHCRFTVSSYENQMSKKTGKVMKTLEPLKDSMARLLNDSTLSDVVIKSGNETFHCHKIILTHR